MAGTCAVAITLWVYTPLHSEAPVTPSLSDLNQDTLRALSESQEKSPTPEYLRSLVAGTLVPRHDQRRHYVLSETGDVIAHSIPTYVGTSFKDTPLYKQLKRTAFHPEYDQSASLSAGSGSFTSVDQLPVLIAYRRIPGHPYVFVSEAIQSSAIGSTDPLQFLVAGTLATGALMLLALANLLRKLRKKKLVTPPASEPDSNHPSWKPVVITHKNFTPVAKPASGAVQAGPIHPVTNSQSVVQALDRERRLEQTEQEILGQFQLSALKLREPKMVASILTEAASQLCKSPTLFMRYDAKFRSFSLETESGLDGGSTPHVLQLSLSEDALRRIEDLTSTGLVASLAQFEPLAKLLIQRLGVSYYEAWVLSSTRENQPNQIYGLLVILQASLDSIQRRDFLMSMIKTTGLIYDRELR